MYKYINNNNLIYIVYTVASLLTEPRQTREPQTEERRDAREAPPQEPPAQLPNRHHRCAQKHSHKPNRCMGHWICASIHRQREMRRIRKRSEQISERLDGQLLRSNRKESLLSTKPLLCSRAHFSEATALRSAKRNLQETPQMQTCGTSMQRHWRTSRASSKYSSVCTKGRQSFSSPMNCRMRVKGGRGGF